MNQLVMPSGSSTLRLEAVTGDPMLEYRIDNGKIEVRKFQPQYSNDPEPEWQAMKPEQLRMHVERKTVVAEWLKRRLGWRRLLRACLGDSELVQKAA